MDVRGTKDPGESAREQALAALRRLPRLSAVAIQLQLVPHEDLEIDDAAETIRADAALSADVLRLANSPLFGLGQPANSILHAVVLLGLNRIVSFVITAALRSFGNPARGTAALRRCWRHGLACGLICEDLAEIAGLDSDIAYTAGLLHDIGRSGMLGVWTKRYAKLLDEATPEPLALLASERQELGITHVDAGACLLRDWRLPEVLVEVAQFHHDLTRAGAKDYVGMAHCGCAMADALGFVVSGKAGVEGPAPDIEAPWCDVLAALPEEYGPGIVERVDSLEGSLLR
jgi:putative nucleotidyltransferase with HDIG domain